MSGSGLDRLIAELEDLETARKEEARVSEEERLRRIIREEIAKAANTAEERVWGDCCGCASSALLALASAAE